MQQNSERFEMRLDLHTLQRLDKWRADQPDLPSRAAAIRRLMDAGLSMGQPSFRPSVSEKLIIAMLCELYRHLEMDGGLNSRIIEEASSGGHPWALRWEYPPLFEGTVVEEDTALEVADILEMWWTIELSYDRLSKEEQVKLETNAGITRENTQFRGFDGNEESTHYHVARVLICVMERFQFFKERGLNSHSPSLPRYRKILARYKPMKQQNRMGDLTSEQIAEIIRGA